MFAPRFGDEAGLHKFVDEKTTQLALIETATGKLEEYHPPRGFELRAGYDQRLGARPLQRAIERLVATPLARWKVMNPGQKDLTLRLSLGESGKVVVHSEKV